MIDARVITCLVSLCLCCCAVVLLLFSFRNPAMETV